MMSHELLRHHRNIVRLLGISWHDQESVGNSQPGITPSLLVELAASANGKPLTLETYVEQTKHTAENLVVKTQLLHDIASGLSALHALGVVHGDVKPENILLFEESDRLVAKISDFGFCIAGDDDLKSARGGTQYWNAPECLVGAPLEIRKHHSESTRDFFSYGLVIW
jgi:serine/threonine protein kinase